MIVVDGLAAYRLTRLVVVDDLTETVRARVVGWAYKRKRRWPLSVGLASTAAEQVAADSHPPKLAKLVTCPWCASFYVALLVVAARRWLPKGWAPLADALAYSAVAGLIAARDH